MQGAAQHARQGRCGQHKARDGDQHEEKAEEKDEERKGGKAPKQHERQEAERADARHIDAAEAVIIGRSAKEDGAAAFLWRLAAGRDDLGVFVVLDVHWRLRAGHGRGVKDWAHGLLNGEQGARGQQFQPRLRGSGCWGEKMGWFVRYIDDELKHEMVSRELASEEEALEEAWQLAQGNNEVLGIDGPDEDSVPLEEIELWFETRAAAGEKGSTN